MSLFPRRGRHKENVFLISTRFPFGFLRKSTTLALQKETIVYPALEPFPGAGTLLDQFRIGGTGVSGTRPRPGFLSHPAL